MNQNSKFKIQNSSAQKAFHLSVSGDVQGVSYRYFAKKEAVALGLVGWAKNEYDGSVLIFTQGPPEKLDEFTAWAKEGSPMAAVEAVVVSEIAVDESLRSFEVR